MSKIREGDYIIIMDREGNKWLTRVSRGREFHTHLGKIDLEKLIGLKYGSIIETRKGKKLYILKPTIQDFILKGYRPTQIVYPKDIGYLLTRLDIRPGSNILEVGMGSGAITSTLIQILSGKGEIDSYERRMDIADIAIKNISRLNHREILNIHLIDIGEARLPKEYYDTAIIDIDSPWIHINKIYYALKPSGGVAFILPTYNQLDKLLPSIKGRFIDVEAIEIGYRRIQAKEGRIRPEFTMIGFTAILLTGYKVG